MMELDIVASILLRCVLTRLRTDGGLGCYLLLTLAERITLALVCIIITSQIRESPRHLSFSQ